jgi:hypothetical protein
MFKFFKKLWKDARGNALVIAGASLPLIMGSAGLASDTIQWVLWKRQLQRVADSAAMAGVYAEVSGNSVGTCSSSNIPTATYTDPVAYDIRKNNHTGMTPNCTLTNPPSTGAFSTDNFAVNVNLSVQRQLSFSSMFMSTAPTITASATATIVPGGQYCAISLINTSTTGISAGGSTNLNLGCGMITNSVSMDAAVAFGSSTVTASPIAAVGGIDANDNWGPGTVLQPFTLPQPDPFASVNPPTPTGCQKFSDLDPGNNNKPNGTLDLTSTLTAGGTYCIKENSGTLSIQGNVILPSGTYVLDATTLNMTNNNASLTCHQCTFILTSSTASTDPSSVGKVSLQGGQLDLTAPDSGTYAGIMIYQDRRAATCTSNCNLINGNATSTMQGALYVPHQQLTFSGTSGMSTNCLQMVALTLQFTGNSSINNTCPAGSASHAFSGRKVRLVA